MSKTLLNEKLKEAEEKRSKLDSINDSYAYYTGIIHTLKDIIAGKYR